MNDIKESPEVVKLVQESKKGNEVAYEELYKKYTPLLKGKFIKKFIKTSTDAVENDDINSIMGLIFVETVNSYDPEKSKFMTHLTNMVRFKFMGHYLGERMMPFTNNANKEKIIKKLNNTRCILTDNIFGMLENEGYAGRLSFVPKLICFEYQGQKLDMPLNVFLDTFLLSVIDNSPDEDSNEIFKYYVSLVSQGEKGISSKLRKKFKRSLLSIKKSLDDTVTFINQNIKFLEIKN